MVNIGTRRYPENLDGISLSTLERKRDAWEKTAQAAGLTKSKKKLCNRQLHRIGKRIAAEQLKRGDIKR